MNLICEMSGINGEVYSCYNLRPNNPQNISLVNKPNNLWSFYYNNTIYLLLNKYNAVD